MKIVKERKRYAAMVIVATFLSMFASPAFGATASSFVLHSTATTSLSAGQTFTLMDIELPNPSADSIIRNASGNTPVGQTLKTTTLKYVDANGNAAYDSGELLLYDAGAPSVLETGDFHESGNLPTAQLQTFSAVEPNFVGYLDADGNSAYTVGERIVQQEMAGTSGTLSATPDPIPFNANTENFIDLNNSNSYDSYEPIILDADNDDHLSAGDYVLSDRTTNNAPQVRRFDANNGGDQKVCYEDSGTASGALDDSDQFWWDSASACTSYNTGTDIILTGVSPVVSGNSSRVTSATNMSASLTEVWLGYYDDNGDGAYTCSRNGICEALIKQTGYASSGIVAGEFSRRSEFYDSSTDVNGCGGIAGCLAWDETGGPGLIKKDTDLYFVWDAHTSGSYDYKHDILDTVYAGTVSNPSNGLLRAFPSSMKFYASSSTFTGAEAIVSITGTQTLQSQTDIKKSGPIALSNFSTNTRFADLDNDNIRDTNEDLISDLDLSGTYQTHALSSVSFTNAGTALNGDLAWLKLYQENGSSVGYDAADALIASLTGGSYFGQNLVPASAVQFTTNANARRIYAVAQVAASPVNGRTIQGKINTNAVAMTSGEDGPTDSAVTNGGVYTVATGGPPDTTPPPAPPTFSSTPGNAKITLNWTNPTVSDFAGVTIRMSTGTYPTSATSGTEVYNGSSTSATVTGLTNGTQYYFGIYAYDTSMNYSTTTRTSNTPVGSADTTPPGPVSGVISTGGNGLVSLSWTNPTASDFTGVVIRSSISGYPTTATSGTEAFNGTATSTSTVITGLTNGTTYYFSIFA
ncbi:MAG: fibronectin type III domain-containing protein, partial [Patescibacteria group bacterium]